MYIIEAYKASEGIGVGCREVDGFITDGLATFVRDPINYEGYFFGTGYVSSEEDGEYCLFNDCKEIAEGVYFHKGLMTIFCFTDEVDECITHLKDLVVEDIRELTREKQEEIDELGNMEVSEHLCIEEAPYAEWRSTR